MAMGLTQPVPDMSTRDISGEGGGGGNLGRWGEVPPLAPLGPDFLKILEASTLGTLWACNRPVQGFLYLY